MDVWDFVQQSEGPVALLYVTESKGSSPGRAGFKMALNKAGEMCGSIGGGIMEQRLIAEAGERLRSGKKDPILRRQIHLPNLEKDSSGLICSGEQTVAILLVDSREFEIKIQSSDFLILSSNGIEFSDVLPGDPVWAVESLHKPATVYIIGGGHVGLALSQTMSQLNFRVEVFDDRAELNTLARNHFADARHIGPLKDTLPKIPDGSNVYIVAVTFGVETDLIVLDQLSERKVRYFGLMGSRAKRRKLETAFGELRHIRCPVGLPIHSHTPQEIAISIAAEIVRTKNETL